MKKLSLLLSLGLFILFALQSCGFGGSKTQEAEESEAKNDNSESVIPGLNQLTEATKQIEDLAKNIESGKSMTPVNFRKLKAFLPAKAAGIAQTDASGETTGVQGFNISKAEATYKGSDNKNVKVEIMDAGGMSVMLLGLPWLSIANIDKEDKDGYERTLKHKGYKAYEKFETKSKRGSFSLFVGDRYIVNADGDNVTIDELRATVDGIDLSGLASLKPDQE